MGITVFLHDQTLQGVMERLDSEKNQLCISFHESCAFFFKFFLKQIASGSCNQGHVCL